MGSNALKFATVFWFGVAVETFVPLVLPPIGSAAILGAGAAGFGGGGAEAGTIDGKNGGSGIVIIRYKYQ